MAPDSTPALSALRNSHDRLASLVQPLTPEQLRAQSYDRDWSVAQVLSHLGSGAEIALLMLDSAVDERETPDRTSFPPIWESWNNRGPDEQAADALQMDERHVQRLETLTPEQRARVHLSLMGMELDAEGVTRMRLGEHALHTWDIAVMEDPTAQIAPDAVPYILDALPRLAGFTGKPQGRSMRLHVHTWEPDRDLLLDVGEHVSITHWSSGAAEGELRLPAEAFVRLVYGRLDPEHTPGDTTTRNVDIDELRRIFPGF